MTDPVLFRETRVLAYSKEILGFPPSIFPDVTAAELQEQYPADRWHLVDQERHISLWTNTESRTRHDSEE